MVEQGIYSLIEASVNPYPGEPLDVHPLASNGQLLDYPGQDPGQITIERGKLHPGEPGQQSR